MLGTMAGIRGTFKDDIRNFKTLVQKKEKNLKFSREEGKKHNTLEWLKIHQQEPSEPEGNGENDVQIRILYPSKIPIKGEDRR